MSTTAFITRCWKSAHPDLAGLLFCACLALLYSGAAHAQSGASASEISQLQAERTGDAVLLSASVKFDLPGVVEEALLKGVPMIFVAEADVVRERWYWINKKVANVERHMRLSYQPLTRRWRLQVASGVITQAALGVALNQNFETLADAMAAVQRISRWKIADSAELDPESRYRVEFRFRLDTSQLPRPFQIGTLGQADWTISVATHQALPPESGK